MMLSQEELKEKIQRKRPYPDKVESLGFGVAQFIFKDYYYVDRLIIITPSDYEDGSYQPAESVMLMGRDSIIKLRDFLNECLEENQIPCMTCDEDRCTGCKFDNFEEVE